MAIRALSEAETRELATRGRLEVVRQNESAPPPVNLAASVDLFGSTFLPIGRHLYEVPPVSSALGLELTKLRLRLNALPPEPSTPAEAEEEERLCRECKALFPRIVRPTGRLRRLLWPITPNPFRDLSAREVAECLGFFWTCRMRSRVSLPSPAVRPGRRTI